MKKVICLILVAAMMLGFIAMLAIETFAAPLNEELDYDDLKNTASAVTSQVNITLADIYDGYDAYPASSPEVEGGLLFWDFQWLEADGQDMMGSQFEAGKYYAFRVTLLAPEGTTYNPNAVSITVNREWYRASYEYGENYESILLTVEIYVDKHPDTADAMEIWLTMPDAEPGTAIPAVPQVLADTEDVVVTARWEETPAEGATFQEGQRYGVKIWMERADGRPFDRENTNIWLNGSYSYSYGYTNNNKTFYISDIQVTSQMEGCGYIWVVNLPEEIEPGAATLPDVGTKAGMVDIANVQWLNGNKQPVTTFENGKLYYLAVTLKAQPGYYIPNGVAIDYELWGLELEDQVHTDSKTCTLYFRYSLVPRVDEVCVTINQPQEGMSFSDLILTVDEGEAVRGNISVNDPETGMPVSETKFLPGKTYAIWYEIKPAEGWEFAMGHTGLEVAGTDQGIEWNTDADSIRFPVYFSTCQKIEQVALTVSGLTPGQKLEDVAVSVPGDAPYTVYERYVYDRGNGEPEDYVHVFEDRSYYMEIMLKPKDGYAFSDYAVVKINGLEVSFNTSFGGLELRTWETFGFTVETIELRENPEMIEPGAATVPELREVSGQVILSSVKWVDSNKQPVTQFREGNIYYLAVTVDAVAPRKFVDEPSVDISWSSSETQFEKLSDTKAVVYIRYSLEPDVGAVAVTATGLEVGKNVADVVLTATGNATVTVGEIYKLTYVPEGDYYERQQLTEGVFESGAKYQIHYLLTPKAGYRFGNGNTEITFNGQRVTGWEHMGQSIRPSSIFHTCQELTKAELTMTEPTVGKSFADLKPTAPQNANFILSYDWVNDNYGWVEDTDKVEKGHLYNLQITLIPKDGYAFSESAVITINGKVLDADVSEPQLRLYAGKNYNFREAITKIELPAMPKSLTVGQTLPQITVSDSKNYTVYTYWGDIEGNRVTQAEDKSLYQLVVEVLPKEGYTFTEDTKLYVDGKLRSEPDCYIYEDYAAFIGYYAVGMEKISKVELTVSGMEVGKTPTVTIPSGVKYVLEDVAWAQNNDGVMDNGYEVVEILENGKFTFLGVLLETQEGYCFDDTVEIYVNGKKLEAIVTQNARYQYITFLPMGKLGEVAKLTAPKVTVSGKTLTWEAVANADSYEIYRATSKSGKYTKVETVTGTSWTDDALAKTYYYKIKAIYTADSSKNSGYSNVVSVVYKLDAPTMTIRMDETLGKAVIDWTAVEGVKSYEVYRATSETGKYTRLATVKSNTTTYTDKYAAVGTKYFYKVRAVASSSTYNGGYSNILSTTSFCAKAKLSIKLDTATGKPVISWAKVSGASKYQIYRQLPGEEGFTLLAEQTGVTYTDKTAPVDVLCSYQVVVLGKSEALNSFASDAADIACGMAKPAPKGSTSQDGKPTLTWAAVEGAVKYEIYRSTKSSKSYTLVATVEEGTVYTDTSVAAGKTFYYKVKAVGEVSKSADSSYVKLTGKCATPVISVENAASGKPKVSWEKVSGAKQYTVYRATSETGKYSKLGTSKTTSYEDKKASSGKTYYYKVIANGSSSSYNSGYSQIVSCNVICGTPSVTIKIDTATGKPSLSWKKIDAAAGYRIFRKLPGEEGFTLIAEQTAVSFKDTTAPIDTLCIYKVQTMGKTEALDGAETKELSATSGIAQPKLSSGVNSEGKPHFNWAPIEGAVKYEIYRSTKSTKSYTLLATVEDGNAYVDNTVSAGKTYYYKVKAVGEVSKSADSSYVKLTGKCAAPWISIDLHETSGKPVITWEKVSGAKKYTVYRATSLEGKYTKLGTTTKLTYTDSKAKPGTEYYYKVVANGSSSSYNSGYSNIKMAIGYAAQPQVTLKNDSKGKPTVSWKKISEAEKYMVVYVDITDLENESDLTEQFILENMQYVEVSKKKTSTTLSQAQTGRVYMVFVVAVPANEDYSGVSLPGYVTANCAAPKITAKYIQGYNCGTWKAVEGAEFYAIYRSTKSSSGYVLLGYIDNDSSFVDLSAVKGKTYYYKVTACTEYTESAFSNVIKIKTK